MERPRPESLNLDYSKPENQETFFAVQSKFPDVAEQYLNQAEGQAWVENIKLYGQEHYAGYITSELNHQGYLRSVESTAKYVEEVLVDKKREEEPLLINRVENFIGGKTDQELEQIIKESHLPVMDFIKSSADLNDKVNLLLQLIIKDASYEEAVAEQAQEKIEFIGFELDPDYKNVEAFLHDTFGKDILDHCLISEIYYYPNAVNIHAGDTVFEVPVEVYQEWKSKQPQVKQAKVRGGSYAFINDKFFCKRYLSLPVDFYSFVDEDFVDRHEYDNVPEDQKMRRFKLGGLAHEFGHSMYSYLVKGQLREQWEALINEIGHISRYSADYADGSRGTKVDYAEEFCEAIRLYATLPEYLKENSPKVVEFLQAHFPDVKPSLEKI